MGKSGKTIMIVGGYGNAGRLIASYLLQETTKGEVAAVVIAGRSSAKARDAAARLNASLDTDRAVAREVDASKESLERGLVGVDVLVIASSTIAYAETVARAAIDAGIDYFDIQMSSPEKIRTLQSLEEEMKRADCCFVTDGGYHPGLPAAMVRYAAVSGNFIAIESAYVYALIQENWRKIACSDGMIEEFVSEMVAMKPLLYEGGVWKNVGFTTYRQYDFGGEFGMRPCIPIFLEECRLIENVPEINEAGIFVAGFNRWVDWVVTPFVMMTLSLFGRAALRPMGTLMLWALKRGSKPPYGSVISLEAVGRKGDGSQTKMRFDLSHEDGYVITAIPAAACLLQLLRNEHRTPGLFVQAGFVEPKLFVKDIERLGLDVSIEVVDCSPAETSKIC